MALRENYSVDSYCVVSVVESQYVAVALFIMVNMISWQP